MTRYEENMNPSRTAVRAVTRLYDSHHLTAIIAAVGRSRREPGRVGRDVLPTTSCYNLPTMCSLFRRSTSRTAERKFCRHEKSVQGPIVSGALRVIARSAEYPRQEDLPRRLATADRPRADLRESRDLRCAIVARREISGVSKTLERHAQHLCQGRGRAFQRGAATDR